MSSKASILKYVSNCLLLALALILCTPSAWAKQKTRELVHEVRRGETLSHIAHRYDVTVRTLCRANGIDAEKPIRAGQRLLISNEKSLPREKTKTQKKRRKTNETVSRKKASKKAKRATKQKTRKKSKRKPTYWVQVSKKYWRKSHQLGLVDLVGPMGKWSGYVVRADGSLTPLAKRGFQKAMVSRRTGEAHVIDARLIQLVTRASDRFGGRRVHIISGYRPNRVNRFTPHSRHADGKAIDFRIEGVPNEELRDYLRKIENVGVGYYPNSTHVHLDVRGSSAYWVDYSKPGKAPQYSRPGPAPHKKASAGEKAGGGKSSRRKASRSRASRAKQADKEVR